MQSGSLAHPTLSGLPFTHPLFHPPFTPPCRSHSFPILIPFTSPPFRSSFAPTLPWRYVCGCIFMYIVLPFRPSPSSLVLLGLSAPSLSFQPALFYLRLRWFDSYFLHLSMSNSLLSFLLCSAHAVTLSHAPKLIDIPTYLRSINLPLPLCISPSSYENHTSKSIYHSVKIHLASSFVSRNLVLFHSLTSHMRFPQLTHLLVFSAFWLLFLILVSIPLPFLLWSGVVAIAFFSFSLILWERVSLTFICAYPSLSSFLSLSLLLFHPASSPPPLSPLLVQLILCFRPYSRLFSLWLSLLLFCWLMTCQRIPLETGAFSPSYFLCLLGCMLSCARATKTISLSLWLSDSLILSLSDALSLSLSLTLSVYMCIYL